MKIKKLHTTIIFLLFWTANTYSQTVDENFNVLVKGTIEWPVKVAAQENKIIVGGQIISAGNKLVHHIVRVNEDGTQDETFNLDFEITGRINDIFVQADDKIMVTGQNLSEFGDLIRINNDGSRDNTFAIPSSFRNIGGLKICKQSSGAYIIASFSTNSNVNRFNENGSYDNSFRSVKISGIGINNFDIEVDSEDNIILGGTFEKVNSDPSLHRLIKLTSNGNVISEFSSGSGITHTTEFQYIKQIKVLKDNSILVSGNFDMYNSIESKGLAKLKSNGDLDLSFELDATISGITDDGFYFLEEVGGNKILLGSPLGFQSKKIYRVNQDGSIDNTFNIIEHEISDELTQLYSPTSVVLENGNIATFGGIITQKALGSGSADSEGNITNYTPSITGIGFTKSLAKDLDGGILVGGKFLMSNEFKTNNILRIDKDGNFDQDFLNTIGSGFDGAVNAIIVQENGKTLIAGKFSKYNNQWSQSLVRLSEDYSLDATFDADHSNYFIYHGISSIEEHGDGLLLCGSFNTRISAIINEEYAYNFFRINSDGSLDTDFNTVGLLNSRSYVKAIKTQEDGKVIIGGEDSPNGGFLLRVNSDGSKDSSFSHDLDLTNRQVTAIDISQTNEIIVATEFSNYYPQNESKVIWCLNFDGSINRSSQIKVTSTGAVNKIKPLNGDTILLAGDFTEINNRERKGIAVVTLGGEVMNHNFQIGIDRTDDAERISDILIDGNYSYIAGKFTKIGGNRNFSSLAKIKNCESDGFLDVIACNSYEWQGKTLTESGSYETILTNALGCDSVAILNLDIVINPEPEIISGEQIQFSNNTLSYLPSTNESKKSYQWFECSTSETIEGAVEDKLEIQESGEFFLKTIDSFNCPSISECFNATYILDLEKKPDFNAYPNPFHNRITLDLAEPHKNLHVDVMDISGSKVANASVRADMSKIILNLSELSPGIYSVIIRSNNKVFMSKKIIKRPY
ncbi:MAG: T9SS type A sorting domain-containing protein [Reichenbachiella sp.]|uniref:T9SS type A sorting domain-containing protein n=1 Tax=Reichenbachiella sp. TaxID=2184521 RepID=UPI003297F217